jgi:hypothetical protein
MKVAALAASGHDEDLPTDALAPSTGEPAQRPDPADDAAVVAAGPVDPLAAAVADKLLDLATDRYDMAVSRAEAAEALAILAEILPAETLVDIARRLVALAHEPQFGPQDDAEVHGTDPLRGFRLDLGGRILASRALLTAAQIYQRAMTADPALADADLAADMLNISDQMLRSGDDAEAVKAAAALTVLARLLPVDLRLLASHRLGAVRALAIHGWAASGQPPGLAAQLAADPEARVRRSVALFAAKIRAELGPAAADPVLDLLRADRAWSVRYHVARFLQ